MKKLTTNRRLGFAMGLVASTVLFSIVIVPEILFSASTQGLPLPAKKWAGSPTFAIVGPKNLTMQGLAATDLKSEFRISAPSSMTSRFLLLDSGNGTLTIPFGTRVYASVNGTSFQLQPPDGNGPFSTSDPLVLIGRGTSLVIITAVTPQSAQSGNYHFTIAIATFSNSTANFVSYGDGVTVNLTVN